MQSVAPNFRAISIFSAERSRVGHIAAEFERLANVLLGRGCGNPALITYPQLATQNSPNDFDAIDFIAVNRRTDKEARARARAANHLDRKRDFCTGYTPTDGDFESLSTSGGDLMACNFKRAFGHFFRTAAFFLARFFLSTILRSTSIMIGPLRASRPKSIR